MFSAPEQQCSLLKVGDDFPRKHLAQIPNTRGVLYTNTLLLSGFYWGCLCLLLMDVGPWHLSTVFCPSSPVSSTVATVTWEALRYMEPILRDRLGRGVVFSGILQVILMCNRGTDAPIEGAGLSSWTCHLAVTKGPTLNCVLCSCHPEINF